MDFKKMYLENKISNDEYILLTFLNTSSKIDEVYNFLKNKFDVKLVLKSLVKKKIITIDIEKNIIEKNIKLKVQDKNKEKNLLTAKEVDEIRVLINREITVYELEKLREWIEKYSYNIILDAFYKALRKDIDNFNYIEKILINNTVNNTKSKINRNFELY